MRKYLYERNDCISHVARVMYKLGDTTDETSIFFDCHTDEGKAADGVDDDSLSARAELSRF